MIQLLAGDCRDVLATLPAESVQCVVTSPPYYGLRDYGTALWDGGDAACDHGAAYREHRNAGRQSGVDGGIPGSERDPPRAVCKCGARRIDRQIGLEATPDEYLATMVAVFREVRRVLRRDGTVWCNIGDSYVSNVGVGGPGSWARTPAADGVKRNDRSLSMRPDLLRGAAKPKDLLMMPARLALALQADGWWVRSDIIWHKPNPMPESCTDRPTSAHEHVFLLTRSARYYYDSDGVREEAINEGRVVSYDGTQKNTGHENRTYPGAKPRDIVVSGRNLRNVWTLPTQSFSGSHFATFPTALAERCIRAGTSERGACSQCGKAWGRETERTFTPQTDVSLERGIKGAAGQKPMDASSSWDGVPRGTTTAVTTGWSAACVCNAGDPVPCKVLDPFIGAGTTALVADRLQRDCIGIDLNVAYTEMAMQRCRDDAPLFTAFPPAEPPEDARMADLFADAEYAQLPPPKPDAFRNSGRHVNQGLAPSNGQPEAAE